MTNLKFTFLLACSFSLLMGCSSSNDPESSKPVKKETKNPLAEYKKEVEEAEKYIAYIDSSETLTEGNSLYYTNGEGQSYEVTFKINDTNQLVRITERYAETRGGSIESSIFYYRGGTLYASKEYIEKGTGTEAYFVERVSYYDNEVEPIVTKMRSAPFEEALEQEVFKIDSKHKCSDAKALRALYQQDEFETNFRGFVDEGQMRYLLVGENKEGGYETALLVQYRTPFIQSLYKNANRMMGTKLEVNFKTMYDVAGYSFQSLIQAREVVEKKIN